MSRTRNTAPSATAETAQPAPTASEAPTTGVGWAAFLTELDGRRTATERRKDALVEKRRRLALDAQLGDADARRERDEVTAEMAALDLALDDLAAARQDAEARRQAALQSEEDAADRFRAARVLELVEQRRQLAEAADAAIEIFAEACRAWVATGRELREVSRRPMTDAAIRLAPGWALSNALQGLERDLANMPAAVDPSLRKTLSAHAAHLDRPHHEWASGLVKSKGEVA